VIRSLFPAFALVLALAIPAAPAPAADPAPIPDGAICVANDVPVLRADFDALMQQARRNYRNQDERVPPRGSSEHRQLVTQAVGYLVEQELYQQEARKLGIVVSEAAVDQRLRQLKESFFQGDREKYEDELRRQGLTEEDVRENIRQQMITQALFETVTADVEVSRHDAYRYYLRNREQYDRPASRKVAHILVKSKRRAWNIYWYIDHHGTYVFRSLARTWSEDPSSAENGGRLTANRGQLVPQFERVAFRLSTGAVSTPVKTVFGYHIIHARGPVRPGRRMRFRQVREQILQTLEQERRSSAMQDWRDDMFAAAEVSCREGFPYAWGGPPVRFSSDRRSQQTPGGIQSFPGALQPLLP
jgi:foldase protein PrsA